MKTINVILFHLMVTFLIPMSAYNSVSYTLDNGLQVALINDPSASIVNMKTTVKVGSIYESEYLGTGISHYLEHLVAGGTTSKHSEDEYIETLSLLGGVSNAYTTTDHTAYFINTTATHLETGLNTLYEWMFYCSLKQSEVDREKEVITREIEKNNVNNSRQFYYLAQQNNYKSHPTRFPVIGYLEQFLTVEREDLERFYKRHYTPSNMILVVGGPIDIEKTKAIIDATFGSQPRTAQSTYPTVAESIPFNSRTVKKELPMNSTLLSLRFSTIDLFSDELYALDLLDYILGNGEQSLLYKKIVDELKLAYSISSTSYTPHYANGYFEVFVETDEENIEPVTKEILKILESCKHIPFDKKLVAKSKKQKIAENILGINSIEDKASQIGFSLLYTENTEFFDDYTANFKDTTAEDIQAVAKKYFDMDKLITTIAVPEKSATSAESSSQGAQSLNSKKITLDNGVRVLFIPNDDLPKTKAQIMVLGGLLHENESNNGIGALTASLLGTQTSKREKDEIQSLFEDNGAFISGNNGNHTLYYTLDCLSEDFDTLFPLFLETFFDAQFNLRELNESKRKTINAIKQREDSWHSANSYEFKKRFWKQYPYGLSRGGEIDSVNSLDPKDIHDFFYSLLNPDNIVITLHGDFDESDATTLLNQHIENLSQSPSSKTAIEPPVYGSDSHESLLHKHDVSSLFMGFKATSLQDQHTQFKLDLVDAVLSGMSYPGGRLHKKLRDNGYVYLVHGINFGGLDTGYFYIYALSNEDSIAAVKTAILEEIESLKNNPISQGEFKEAIERMRFYYQERLSSADHLMLSMSTDELYFNNYLQYQDVEKQLEALTSQDVMDTAKQFLNYSQTVTFHPEKD